MPSQETTLVYERHKMEMIHVNDNNVATSEYSILATAGVSVPG